MAMRLVQQNIQAEQAVGAGRKRLAAEGTVMLPGGARDVELLQTTAKLASGRVEVQTGRVVTDGSVYFTAVFKSADGLLRAVEAMTPFSVVIEIPKASPRMNVQVSPHLTTVSAQESGGRLALHADVDVMAFLTEGVNLLVTTDLQSDEQTIARNTQEMEITRQSVEARERELFSENFFVEDNAMTRVLLTEAYPQITQVQAMDGSIAVEGKVVLATLLTGDTVEVGAVAVDNEIPFALTLDAPESRIGQQVSAGAQVQDLVSEITKNVDEQVETNLRVEYVLEIVAQTYVTDQQPLLSDAYPLDTAAFVALHEDVRHLRKLSQESETEEILFTMDLPTGSSPISKIISVTAAPEALEVATDERVEGLIRVTLLYRGIGSTETLQYIQEFPFSHEFDDIEEWTEISAITLGQPKAEVTSPMQAQVRIPITVRGIEQEEQTTIMLTDTTEAGEPVNRPRGMALYYPRDGETDWDVAKRYRLSLDQLTQLNPGAKPPYLIYSRLEQV